MKFLIGRGIPDHIINMPQAVLNSPMGRMLMPQLNQTVSTARRNGSILGIQPNGAATKNNTPAASQPSPSSTLRIARNLQELNAALESAKGSCAVIFFTSATCPPCRTLYPLYDELAAETAGRAVLVKVDISQAVDVSNQFSVRATPTFMTFLRGEKENQWSGADPAALRGNVQLLVQMAWPRHPHESLNLPSFSNPTTKPVLFSKVPPMQKLLAKMGSTAQEPGVQALKHFVEVRAQQGPAEAVLPDMNQLATLLQKAAASAPPDSLFALVDLFRCGAVDPRISGYYAEEKEHTTINSLLNAVNNNKDCPYALRLVTLQMACNLFSSPLYTDEMARDEVVRTPIIQLISSSFLDDSHSSVRVASASLMFNVALANGKARRDGSVEDLPEGDQVELAASVVEAIGQEESSPEALQGMLLGLGHLVYRAPLDGELVDLLRAMDAEDVVLAKQKSFPGEKLVAEVGKELLGKGLRRS